MRSLSPSRSRGHVAVRGLIAASVGTVLMVWPSITLGTVIALFAIFSVSDAVATATRAFRHDVSGGDRALLGLRAAIELIAGGVAIAYPDSTVAIMTVIIGISVITVSGLELAGIGMAARLGAKGYGWDLAGGVLGVMTGVALLAAL